MENNTLKNERSTGSSFWKALLPSEAPDAPASCLDQTSISILKFAEKHLDEGTVLDVYGSEHNASYYAMCLFVTADKLVNEKKEDGKTDLTLTNQIFQCAHLVALEESYYAKMEPRGSYGSRLLFNMRRAGIKLPRPLIAAFLAQEGTWSTNRSKNDLMDGNTVAVAIYCSRLTTLCRSLLGLSNSLPGNEEALKTIEVNANLETTEDVIRYYLENFAISYLEAAGSKNAKEEVETFLTYLKKTDFFSAPCSTKYHMSVPGGLTTHSINVMMQLLWLTLPATKQQLGGCVLAALGHDLCKIGVYKANSKNKKFYITEGMDVPAGVTVKEDNSGQFYWGQETYYEFKDSMPFGHGRKSAYLLQGFFPEISYELFAAVDGHMGEPEMMQLYSENILALNLHIADMLASNLIEHNQ